MQLTRKSDGDKVVQVTYKKFRMFNLKYQAMLVVISEFFYGINEFMKRALAGKRITKVQYFSVARRSTYGTGGIGCGIH